VPRRDRGHAGGAYVVGQAVPDDTLVDFPADLFLILIGVTDLFALAKNNGTVDWLVQASRPAQRLIGRRRHQQRAVHPLAADSEPRPSTTT
jgi:hypothetical protein